MNGILKDVDHIAIAVEDIDTALSTYEALFGVKATHRERVADYDVEIATVTVGHTSIEFLEGMSADSPIRKFVEKRGPGLHHIAFAVDDIKRALHDLRAAGARLIDETPRRGKENSLVAFIHPGSTGKVLCELVQPAPRGQR